MAWTVASIQQTIVLERSLRVSSTSYLRSVTSAFVLRLTSVAILTAVVARSAVGDLSGTPPQAQQLRHDHMAAHEGWKMTHDPNSCAAADSGCYNTGQCCPGFVCAADHHRRHLHPAAGGGDELPGTCVKVRDVTPCSSSDSCDGGAQCVSAGSRAGYCSRRRPVDKSQDGTATEGLQSQDNRNSVNNDGLLDHLDEVEGHGQWTATPGHMYREHHGGLGSPCDDDSQCHPFTQDAVDRLCCQDVHRGRQGTKRMCDRITRLSLCIAPPHGQQLP